MAWDFYEVAEMLRRFLMDVTDEWVPNIDDLGAHPELKQHLLGMPREAVDYDDALTKARVMENYRLDTGTRVWWLLEGRTEITFIEETCREWGIDLRARGVEIVDMCGAHRPSDELIGRFVTRAMEADQAVLVSLDGEDSGAKKAVEALERLGVRRYPLDDLVAERPAHAVIPWHPEFEQANFPLELVFDAWLTQQSHEVNGAPDPISAEQALREKWMAYEAGDRGAVSAVKGFAKKMRRSYCKPKVAGCLARLRAAEMRRDPELTFLPIEHLINYVLSLADR
ncbi:MAG: hypothetical protein GF320_14490 [Armatimonadia bacterium]|nr:hypothetical protein [Armatimonadia bacterium]